MTSNKKERLLRFTISGKILKAFDLLVEKGLYNSPKDLIVDLIRRKAEEEGIEI